MRSGYKTLAAALAVGFATAFIANDANADAKYRIAYLARSQRELVRRVAREFDRDGNQEVP